MDNPRRVTASSIHDWLRERLAHGPAYENDVITEVSALGADPRTLLQVTQSPHFAWFTDLFGRRSIRLAKHSRPTAEAIAGLCHVVVSSGLDNIPLVGRELAVIDRVAGLRISDAENVDRAGGQIARAISALLEANEVIENYQITKDEKRFTITSTAPHDS